MFVCLTMYKMNDQILSEIGIRRIITQEKCIFIIFYVYVYIKTIDNMNANITYVEHLCIEKITIYVSFM